jgi:hypothetical protein
MFIFFAVFCVPMLAQVNQDFVLTKKLGISVQSPVAEVMNATVTVSVPGSRVLYYWIVTNKGAYSSPVAGPFVTAKAMASLSSAYSVAITWIPVAGADSYDVLRTTTNAVPSGACNCAVAKGVKVTSFKNTSETLQSYTVPTYSDTGIVYFTNEDLGSGYYGPVARDKKGNFATSPFLPGVASDGANGISVSGSVAASTTIQTPDVAGSTKYVTSTQTLQQTINAYDVKRGGKVQLPCGDVEITGITIDRPGIYQGCGASIGQNSGGKAPTRLICKGSGIAVDIGGTADTTTTRGIILQDLNIVNGESCTWAVRVNSNEPKLVNVTIYPQDDYPTPFAEGGIKVADLEQVNDLVLRDVYVRGQPIGVLPLYVSEMTIDHSRLVYNTTTNLQLGDDNYGPTALHITNGTSLAGLGGSGGGNIVVKRSPYLLDITGSYLECGADASHPGMCLDASAPYSAGTVDHFNFEHNYVICYGDYAVSLNSASLLWNSRANTFSGCAVAAVQNTATSGALDLNSKLMSTPKVFSDTTTATSFDAAYAGGYHGTYSFANGAHVTSGAGLDFDVAGKLRLCRSALGCTGLTITQPDSGTTSFDVDAATGNTTSNGWFKTAMQGTTSSLGGSLLTAYNCTSAVSGTITIAGATTDMGCAVSPVGGVLVGDAFESRCWVSAPNTVVVKVCNRQNTDQTPAAAAYKAVLFK